MTTCKEEAAAIARLLGEDRVCIVGWIYLWNTSELSIRWNGGCRSAKFIEPPLSEETLAKAEAVTPSAVTDLLGSLSAAARKGE